MGAQSFPGYQFIPSESVLTHKSQNNQIFNPRTQTNLQTKPPQTFAHTINCWLKRSSPEIYVLLVGLSIINLICQYQTGYAGHIYSCLTFGGLEGSQQIQTVSLAALWLKGYVITELPVSPFNNTARRKNCWSLNNYGSFRLSQ